MRWLVPWLAGVLVLSGPSAASLLPQDDAGSGGDAGDGPDDALPVEPDVTYDARLEGAGLDADDWYAFDAPAGAILNLRITDSWSCIQLIAPDGTPRVDSCVVPTVALHHIIGEAGTWHLRVHSNAAAAYSFSFAFDHPPPGHVDRSTHWSTQTYITNWVQQCGAWDDFMPMVGGACWMVPEGATQAHLLIDDVMPYVVSAQAVFTMADGRILKGAFVCGEGDVAIPGGAVALQVMVGPTGGGVDEGGTVRWDGCMGVPGEGPGTAGWITVGFW